MSDEIKQQLKQYTAAPGTEILIDQEHLVSVQNYQHITHGDGQILLVPQPNGLPWGNGLFYAVNGAVTGPMMAGEMIQLVTFFKRPLSDITYSNGATLICQGFGTLLWMPMAVKFGRRPVYLASNTLMGIACVWLAIAAQENYPVFVVARAFLGLFEAPIEAIVPSTVTDIFYLHERGEKLPSSAYIIQSLSMRWAFFITAMSVGVSLITMFLFMPETMFTGHRPKIIPIIAAETNQVYESEDKLCCGHLEGVTPMNTVPVQQESLTAKKRSYMSELFQVGVNHKISFWEVFKRPFILMAYPTVVWSSLIYGMSLSWNVILGALVAQLFSSPPYFFDSGAKGLAFISPLFGSLADTYLGGPLADRIATWFTVRNEGIREPEMLLPTCVVAAFLTFVGALTSGLTYHYQTHWAGPIVGFGVLSAGAQMGATLAISYSLDHKELSAEIMVTISCLKSGVACVWTWCINNWVISSGLLTVFMSVTAINVLIYMTTFMFHLYGKKIRIWLQKKNFMGEKSELN